MNAHYARSRRWTLEAMLLVSFVSVPVLAQGFDPNGPLPEGTETEIEGPNGEYDFPLGFFESPRCLAHEMSVGNQGVYFSGSGVYFSGSVGGLVLGDTVTARDTHGDVVFTVPARPAAHALGRASDFLGDQVFAELTAVPASATGVVTILVVDDFAGRDHELPASFLEQLPGQLTEEQLSGLVTSGELSHGALVMAHLRSLIEATESFDIVVSTAERVTYSAKQDEEVLLSVVAVDVSAGPGAQIPTDTIAALLGAAIENEVENRDTSKPLSLVVNMSWVLLPCPTVADFLDAHLELVSFDRYVASLAIGSDGDVATTTQELERRLSLLSWVPQSDQLSTLISDIDSRISGLGTTLREAEVAIVFVAAAGNFSMDYQMLPAALPNVLGVGTPTSREPPPDFSNAADVAAPGAWFHVNGIVSYAGTSYSAPLVSLVAAANRLGHGMCVPYAPVGSRPGFNIAKSGASYIPARVLLGDAAASCGHPE